MGIDDLDNWIHLRIIILTLGESHHANWWHSQFLSPTGFSYLTRIYPRAAFAVSVRSALRGALELHDASIGKGGVYHLFRLPNGHELRIENQLTRLCSELESTYLPILSDRVKLIDRLSQLAGDDVNPISWGAVQIPTNTGTIQSNLASVYLSGFRNDKQVFPYFLQDSE